MRRDPWNPRLVGEAEPEEEKDRQKHMLDSASRSTINMIAFIEDEAAHI